MCFKYCTEKIFLFVLLYLLLPFSLFAATINVPGDQPTIQAGIDASVNGDIVLLADGTYTGNGNYNIDLKGKTITIKSINGPSVCIVDCEGLGRGFLAYNDEAVTFEGLTIENGDAGVGNNGGGVYINGSDIIVIDCVFENNSADNGGAVYSSSSESSYTNCTFTSNNADDGGSVYSLSSRSSYTNCNFTSNNADSGGAINFYNSAGLASTLIDCTFTSNNAHSGGAFISAHTTLTTNNCTFENNSAFFGGATYYYYSFSTSNNCTYLSNSASARGGAVYFPKGSSPSTSSNCTFVGNSAPYGGAVYFSSLYSTRDDYFFLTNCTLTHNEATTQGGAIYCDTPFAPEDPTTLKNCILWGNTAPEGPEIYENEKPLIITYSDIQGGHAGDGNIDEDPLFINAENDFHLQATSPCIDAGTVDSAPSDDLDGNYRPVGSGYDMGAYEFQGTVVIDSFTASPTTGKPSLTVDFTCTAHDDINTITEYQWNFGDGNNNTTLTGAIQHIYTIPGTFSATCTVVNDNADQTTTSTTIEVTNDIPIADAGPNQIIPGNNVELDGSASNDPDGTITSWEWTLEHLVNSANNKTATGEIPTVSNLEYGNYTVTLTVTDNYGAQGTDEMYLSVAASEAKYTQVEYEQAQQESYDEGHTSGVTEGYATGYNDGYTSGQDDCEQCPIHEDAEGNKFLDGPLTIEDNGLLTIQ